MKTAQAGPDLLPVQSVKLRSEHSVWVTVREAADRDVARIEADVRPAIEAREQADLREHATPVTKTKPTCPAQSLKMTWKPCRSSGLAVARSGSWSTSRIGLSYSSTRMATFRPESQYRRSRRSNRRFGSGPAACGRQTSVVLSHLQLREDTMLEIIRIIVLSSETQPPHRMPGRPVPMPVYVKAPERLFVALEQRSQCIQNETLGKMAQDGTGNSCRSCRSASG